MAKEKREKTKEEKPKRGVIPEGEHGKIWVEWTFPEYTKYKRTGVWYFWFFIISIGLLVFAIMSDNPLFAVIIAIVGLIIFLQSRKEPRQINFQITEGGIILERRFYEYGKINKFWIIYEPPEIKELYFSFSTAIRPELSIPLGNTNPIQVRELLLHYLEEDPTKKSEGFSRGLRRMLKF